MEAAAAAGVAAARKEWRAVPELSELERSKLSQSDERLYEQVREQVEAEFCLIAIDGSLDSDILQQRLHTVVTRKEELLQMEIELRAQLIATSEIMEMRNAFNEHAKANAKLQEQMHERDQKIYELERRMEEKERELHATRLDNEAVWAKEDLLREQSKELQTYRRERDNSEAERAQNIKQIHDFQEHIQEKERQFMELQEQNRIAQEAILFKDEQIREAQAWVTRVQEVDALQRGELQERAEQYNQLWLVCQRQCGEMERMHMHIQHLQLELAEARGGTYTDGSQVSRSNSKDASHLEQSNGSQLNLNGSSTPVGNSVSLQNGNAENGSSFASTGNVSTQPDHVHGVRVAPSSLLGMTTYLQSGQITALHPYVMHQQGIPPSVPSHVPHSHVGHFHSVPAISSHQHWPNQPVVSVSEGSQISSHDQYSLQSETTLPRSDSQYGYQTSVNGQTLHSDYRDVNMNRGVETQDPVVPNSNEEGQFIQVLQSMDNNYLADIQSQQTLHQISSQFNDALRLDSLDHNETEVKNVKSSSNHRLESQSLMMGEFSVDADKLSAEVSIHTNNSTESVTDSASGAVIPEANVAMEEKNTYVVGKAGEVNLLDEKALLACMVRTFPPGSGGRIRISSTLPNRLGKMLAPLHWHDYKKKYGKLDEFVASHPELFVIDGDYIQLREGAQEIIAATAAAAKVAAAAAAPSSYSSLLPPIAVTPMPQNHRLKRAPSDEPTSGKAEKTSNGVSSNNVAGSSIQLTIRNGTMAHKNDLSSSQNTGSSHARPGANSVSKHGRTVGVSSSSRR